MLVPAQCLRSGPSAGQRAWSQLSRDKISSVSPAPAWSLGGLSSEWSLPKRPHAYLQGKTQAQLNSHLCQWDSVPWGPEDPGPWDGERMCVQFKELTVTLGNEKGLDPVLRNESFHL